MGSTQSRRFPQSGVPHPHRHQCCVHGSRACVMRPTAAGSLDSMISVFRLIILASIPIVRPIRSSEQSCHSCMLAQLARCSDTPPTGLTHRHLSPTGSPQGSPRRRRALDAAWHREPGDRHLTARRLCRPPRTCRCQAVGWERRHHARDHAGASEGALPGNKTPNSHPHLVSKWLWGAHTIHVMLAHL